MKWQTFTRILAVAALAILGACKTGDDDDQGDAKIRLLNLSTGYSSPESAYPRTRPEFYLAETFYSRGSRGDRTDVVTIYDLATLAPVGEVGIPPKRAINTLATANVALSDDDRFLAVFNMTPATSLSIVDVQQRAFVAEMIAR